MSKRIEVRREVIVFSSAQNRSGSITLLKDLSVKFLLSLSMEIPQPFWAACLNIFSFLLLKERILVCNQSFSCSSLSAASCDVTVALKEESGSVFSRQLYTAVRSAVFSGLKKSISLSLASCAPAPESLQYICIFLVLWS